MLDQKTEQAPSYAPSRDIMIVLCAFVLIFLTLPLAMLQYQYVTHNWRFPSVDRGVYGSNGMVVSAHRLASEIGRDILVRGGNAFDAAIAVHFALSVVYPRAGNIGGGGFMVYRTGAGDVGALDFREKAPLAAHRDMYLNGQGEVIEGLSLRGALSVGVPGAVAGMDAIYRRFATLKWDALLAPSVKLAREGYVLSEKAAFDINRYKRDFTEVNRFKTAFIAPTPQRVWEAGDVLKSPVLADTLERIMRDGADEFYRGKTARLLLDEMRFQGGLITAEDLRAYRVVWRRPIRFMYQGHEVITMPPPSSGGVALAQLLKGISAYDLDVYSHNSTDYLHLLTELERRVYADRAVHLGDSDFVEVDVEGLTTDDYVAYRMQDIDLSHKTASTSIRPGHAAAIESVETTHISVVDAQGNAVSLTTTLNGNFGSKLVVRGGGFLLNNEMDDFSIKPGYANQFGLLGSDKNAIAPGKRMLSSMTPTIVTRDGELRLVLGTPGGATIITSVFQTLLNVIDFEMSAQQAVNARKAHSQWQPDIILLERGAPNLVSYFGLKRRGHILNIWPQFKYELGRVEAILRHSDGRLEGAADFTRGKDDRASAY